MENISSDDFNILVDFKTKVALDFNEEHFFLATCSEITFARFHLK